MKNIVKKIKNAVQCWRSKNQNAVKRIEIIDAPGGNNAVRITTRYGSMYILSQNNGQPIWADYVR